MPNPPDFGFMRLRAVLKTFPVSETRWWEGVKSGEYPQPYKISTGITAWLVADIKKLCEEKAKQGRQITN